MEQPVVLITGAAGGIGAATARKFAALGWRLVLTDVRAEPLQVLADTLPVSVAFAADVRTQRACQTLLAEVVAATARLDCLVNAAGIWREGPFADIRAEDLDLVLDINLKGTLHMCAAAIPHLQLTRGSIINIASDAGLQGNAGAAAYCASKGGVVLFSKALALELAPQGVRVNAVCPGDVDTPMLAFQADSSGDPQAYRRRLLAGYPQGSAARFLSADEVAAFVAFLAQPEAAGISGAALSIDFGYSAGKF